MAMSQTYFSLLPPELIVKLYWQLYHNLIYTARLDDYDRRGAAVRFARFFGALSKLMPTIFNQIRSGTCPYLVATPRLEHYFTCNRTQVLNIMLARITGVLTWPHIWITMKIDCAYITSGTFPDIILRVSRPAYVLEISFREDRADYFRIGITDHLGQHISQANIVPQIIIDTKCDITYWCQQILIYCGIWSISTKNIIVAMKLAKRQIRAARARLQTAATDATGDRWSTATDPCGSKAGPSKP